MAIKNVILRKVLIERGLRARGGAVVDARDRYSATNEAEALVALGINDAAQIAINNMPLHENQLDQIEAALNAIVVVPPNAHWAEGLVWGRRGVGALMGADYATSAYVTTPFPALNTQPNFVRAIQHAQRTAAVLDQITNPYIQAALREREYDLSHATDATIAAFNAYISDPTHFAFDPRNQGALEVQVRLLNADAPLLQLGTNQPLPPQPGMMGMGQPQPFLLINQQWLDSAKTHAVLSRITNEGIREALRHKNYNFSGATPDTIEAFNTYINNPENLLPLDAGKLALLDIEVQRLNGNAALPLARLDAGGAQTFAAEAIQPRARDIALTQVALANIQNPTIREILRAESYNLSNATSATIAAFNQYINNLVHHTPFLVPADLDIQLQNLNGNVQPVRLDNAAVQPAAAIFSPQNLTKIRTEVVLAKITNEAIREALRAKNYNLQDATQQTVDTFNIYVNDRNNLPITAAGLDRAVQALNSGNPVVQLDLAGVALQAFDGAPLPAGTQPVLNKLNTELVLSAINLPALQAELRTRSYNLGAATQASIDTFNDWLNDLANYPIQEAQFDQQLLALNGGALTRLDNQPVTTFQTQGIPNPALHEAKTRAVLQRITNPTIRDAIRAKNYNLSGASPDSVNEFNAWVNDINNYPLTGAALNAALLQLNGNVALARLDGQALIAFDAGPLDPRLADVSKTRAVLSQIADPTLVDELRRRNYKLSSATPETIVRFNAWLNDLGHHPLQGGALDLALFDLNGGQPLLALNAGAPLDTFAAAAPADLDHLIRAAKTRVVLMGIDNPAIREQLRERAYDLSAFAVDAVRIRVFNNWLKAPTNHPLTGGGLDQALTQLNGNAGLTTLDAGPLQAFAGAGHLSDGIVRTLEVLARLRAAGLTRVADRLALTEVQDHLIAHLNGNDLPVDLENRIATLKQALSEVEQNDDVVFTATPLIEALLTDMVAHAEADSQLIITDEADANHVVAEAKLFEDVKHIKHIVLRNLILNTPNFPHLTRDQIDRINALNGNKEALAGGDLENFRRELQTIIPGFKIEANFFAVQLAEEFKNQCKKIAAVQGVRHLGIRAALERLQDNAAFDHLLLPQNADDERRLRNLILNLNSNKETWENPPHDPAVPGVAVPIPPGLDTKAYFQLIRGELQDLGGVDAQAVAEIFSETPADPLLADIFELQSSANFLAELDRIEALEHIQNPMLRELLQNNPRANGFTYIPPADAATPATGSVSEINAWLEAYPYMTLPELNRLLSDPQPLPDLAADAERPGVEADMTDAGIAALPANAQPFVTEEQFKKFHGVLLKAGNWYEKDSTQEDLKACANEYGKMLEKNTRIIEGLENERKAPLSRHNSLMKQLDDVLKQRSKTRGTTLDSSALAGLRTFFYNIREEITFRDNILRNQMAILLAARERLGGDSTPGELYERLKNKWMAELVGRAQLTPGEETILNTRVIDILHQREDVNKGIEKIEKIRSELNYGQKLRQIETELPELERADEERKKVAADNPKALSSQASRTELDFPDPAGAAPGGTVKRFYHDVSDADAAASARDFKDRADAAIKARTQRITLGPLDENLRLNMGGNISSPLIKELDPYKTRLAGIEIANTTFMYGRKDQGKKLVTFGEPPQGKEERTEYYFKLAKEYYDDAVRNGTLGLIQIGGDKETVRHFYLSLVALGCDEWRLSCGGVYNPDKDESKMGLGSRKNFDKAVEDLQKKYLTAPAKLKEVAEDLRESRTAMKIPRLGRAGGD